MRLKPFPSLLNFALLFICAAAPIGAEEQFRITQVQGPVALLPEGAKKASPAVAHLQLKSGDRLVTGEKGRVEISSKKGTVIELKEKTDFKVESVGDQIQSFFLRAGKFLSRFSKIKERLKKKRKPQYRIKTVVSVGSVRGTELAMVVDENEKLEAAVVEGDVAFGPPEDASDDVRELWKEEEVHIGPESKGLIVEKEKSPVPTLDIPPLVVSSLDWFETVSERVEKIQVEWKDISTEELDAMRSKALEETIDWDIPEKIQPKRTYPKKYDIAPPK